MPAVLKCLLNEEKRVVVNVPGSLPERAQTLHRFAESTEIADKEMLLPLRWEKLLQAGLELRLEVEKMRGGSRNPLPNGERILQIGNEGAFRLQVENGKAAVTQTKGAPDQVWTGKQAVDSLFSPAGAWLLRDPLLRAWLPLPWGVNTADTF